MSSKKISNFTSQTSYANGDLINIVRNGTNFTVDASALAAYLGVTGTIDQVSNSDAPILEQITSTINNIRGLEDGKGTQVGLTARNNVKVDHNFVNGTSGSEIIQDVTADQTLFRSIMGGTGINVGVSGDHIQISSTTASASSKTIVVSVEADFPTAISGVITLAADTDYLLLQDISTANRFVLSNNTVLRASDSSIVTLTYTGVGTMFTSVDASNKITLIKPDCPNGQLLDISSTVSGSIFQLVNATIKSCDTTGSITGMMAVQFSDLIWDDIKTDGLSFTGAFSLFAVSFNIVTLNGGDFMNLGTATFDDFSASNLFTTLAAGTNLLKGAAASANINAGGLGVLFNARVSGAGAVLSGLTVDDALWNFQLNDDIADTRSDALLSMQANATNTVIASAGTPVLVAGTWVVDKVSQMTGTTAGRVTYNGGKAASMPITSSVTVAPVSGGTISMSAQIAIDGVVVANSKRTASAASGGGSSITVPWQESLSNGQFVEVYVTNEDSTVDLLVSSAIHRVN